MNADLSGHIAREHPKNIPQSVRLAVLDRDNNQCQLCGTGGENRLQIHHIEYRSQGGTHDPANLVTLCHQCHEKVHRGVAKILLLETSPGVWASFPNSTLHLRQHS